MWRKTVWLIATLTLSIFVAPVTAREGGAQNPGKLYRVGIWCLPARPIFSRLMFRSRRLLGGVLLTARFWIGWPTTATFRERTSSSKRGTEDTSNWRNLQRS